MRALRLAGHYGQPVEIDVCAPCHLVWFDLVEGARLSGPGLLALIGTMAEAQTLAHQPLTSALACPRCRGPLNEVHNQTRWGRSRQLECRQRHGAWQTFGQFLAEKGLVRPMTAADRARARQRGPLLCVGCGGEIGADDAECRWCGSAPGLVDIARLAHALDTERATRDHAVHTTAPRGTALGCAACGAAQAADAGWECGQCGATLVAPSLAEAQRAVAALGPALAEHAVRPRPEVVRERLARHEPALQRQRERAAQMQAEADAAAGRERPAWGDVELPWWAWVAVLAAVLALVRCG